MSYERPQIRDYGTLEELTAATRFGNITDGSFTIPGDPNSGSLLTCNAQVEQAGFPCVPIP